MIIEGEFTKQPDVTRYALLVTEKVANSLTREKIESLLTCRPGEIVMVDGSIERIKINDA